MVVSQRADMNEGRSKLSGRAQTSPLLWSGGPGESAELLKRYSGIALMLGTIRHGVRQAPGRDGLGMPFNGGPRPYPTQSSGRGRGDPPVSPRRRVYGYKSRCLYRVGASNGTVLASPPEPAARIDRVGSAETNPTPSRRRSASRTERTGRD